MRYFSNAISFSSKKSGNLETLKDKYIDLTVYPKRTLAVKRVFNLENKQMENRIHLPRYTVLKIKRSKNLRSGKSGYPLTGGSAWITL